MFIKSNIGLSISRIESLPPLGLVGSMAKELEKEENLPIGQKKSRVDARPKGQGLLLVKQCGDMFFVNGKDAGICICIYIYIHVLCTIVCDVCMDYSIYVGFFAERGIV